GPAAVRYPRGTGTGAAIEPTLDTLPIGKAQLRRRGHGIAILAFGPMVAAATEAAEQLDATLVNMRFVKPLAQALVLELAASHGALVSVEDNAVMGGAGSAIGELLRAHAVEVPLLQ